MFTVNDYVDNTSSFPRGFGQYGDRFKMPLTGWDASTAANMLNDEDFVWRFGTNMTQTNVSEKPLEDDPVPTRSTWMNGRIRPKYLHKTFDDGELGTRVIETDTVGDHPSQTIITEASKAIVVLISGSLCPAPANGLSYAPTELTTRNSHPIVNNWVNNYPDINLTDNQMKNCINYFAEYSTDFMETLATYKSTAYLIALEPRFEIGFTQLLSTADYTNYTYSFMLLLYILKSKFSGPGSEDMFCDYISNATSKVGVPGLYSYGRLYDATKVVRESVWGAALLKNLIICCTQLGYCKCDDHTTVYEANCNDCFCRFIRSSIAYFDGIISGTPVAFRLIN